MRDDQILRMKGLLSVILGGIETGNLELSKQAIHRMDAALSICGKCPMGDECPLGINLDADLFERLPRAKAV